MSTHTTSDAWEGAVLCGGASTRMGRDKALVELGGEPLVARVAGVLRTAGAHHVRCVGGDETRLRALGLDVVADEEAGSGPLGGIITALAHAERPAVVVLSCDLVSPDPSAVDEVVQALASGSGAADVAVPLVEGRRQWLHGAWRTGALERLRGAFATGERAIHRAAASLVVVDVDGIAPDAVRDADAPGDLRDHR